ncbi:probable protein phosphatase 2C 25 [Rutidosis leptorrhynchoides]|uniref:probable protein phosphatase 2C 25 n=1 Tax=Rutidosis leptorrhynchoides TaxID=125765 RepID=UPI003A98E717
MSGVVALTNSPVFLSSPMFRQPMISPSSSSSLSLQRTSSTPSSPSSSQLHHKHSNGFQEGQLINCDSSSVILKRKRPARIQIPFSPFNFVDDVKTPVDDVAEIDEEGEAYSVYCKRGRHGAMEDRYSAVVGLQGDSKQALFGVFDGHGGAKAVKFAAKNLSNNIMSQVANKCEDEIVDAIREGYLVTNSEFIKEDVSGGACSVTALIRKGNLIVSNAGDCRAVMSRGGTAEALTVDHKPSRKDEKDRIENLGGYVDCRNGVWRIQGSLAVSRAIGDKDLTKWVIAEPETRIIKIRPECEFLILASDGIWDKVSNQEAIDIVRPYCVGIKKPDLTSACKKLVGLSTTRGSYDDISVMVIRLLDFSA